MRALIIILILSIGINTYAQTDSLEISFLYKKALSNEISGEEFSNTVKKWNETIKKKNIYPQIPFNAEGKIQYSFIIEFPNLTKKMLFNSVLEWLTISYGIIPTNLYSNLEDGRIICNNSLVVYDGITSSYTYTISIKDNKILIDYINLSYRVNIPGYYSGDTWIPESSNYNNIDEIFPIIFKESSKWKSYIDLISTINKQINDDVESLSAYIHKYDARYNF